MWYFWKGSRRTREGCERRLRTGGLRSGSASRGQVWDPFPAELGGRMGGRTGGMGGTELDSVKLERVKLERVKRWRVKRWRMVSR